MVSHLSKQEIFKSYNSLVCLAQGIVGEYTVIDLRNDSSVSGKLEEVDGQMNVCMSDVVYTDPLGNEYSYALFFVKERNIRYIHIPHEVSIIQSIHKGLSQLRRPKPQKSTKRTFKSKRLMIQQEETKAMIEKFKRDNSKE